MSERHRHRLRFQIEQSGHLSLTNDDEMIKVEYVHKRAGDSGARCLLCEHTHTQTGWQRQTLRTIIMETSFKNGHCIQPVRLRSALERCSRQHTAL